MSRAADRRHRVLRMWDLRRQALTEVRCIVRLDCTNSWLGLSRHHPKGDYQSKQAVLLYTTTTAAQMSESQQESPQSDLNHFALLQLFRASQSTPHASCLAVGHVMVLPQHAQHTLLPVATAELVSNDWVPVQAGLNVHFGQCLAAGANDGDLINNGCFLSFLPALPLALCKTHMASEHTHDL